MDIITRIFLIVGLIALCDMFIIVSINEGYFQKLDEYLEVHAKCLVHMAMCMLFAIVVYDDYKR